MRLKILIVIFLPFYWALQWTIHEGKALDDTPGWWTVISRFSTLEDAKNECLTNPECVGITKNQLGYELRKGSVLSSRQTSTTYMKSFIQWIEHTGKIMSGSGMDSFGTLDEAKNKCIDRLNNSNYFIFFFQTYEAYVTPICQGSLKIQSLKFNLYEELVESGEGQCNALYEPHNPQGVYYTKLSPADAIQTGPYVHGSFPNENTWTFYWYTEENFEIDITFEK